MIGHLWCKLAHRRAMWPMRGVYRCSTCLREHPVPWGPEAPAKPDARVGATVEVRP